MSIIETYSNGILVETQSVPDPEPHPLIGAGALATLLAVIGVVTLSDAANAVELPEESLIAEAQAWAVAANKKE